MKLADLRTFTPAHWIQVAIAVVCLVAAVFLVADGLGFRFDPFDLAVKRADRAVADAGRARSDASARRVEVAGAQANTRIVERAAADRAAAAEIIHRYALQLETPSHVPIPIADDGDDGDDLRDVFDQLCTLRPSVCANPGHAASAGDAADGASVLPDPAAPR